MATQLYIIRHGEAVCNVDNIIGGSLGCQGLTERGYEQVARLGERLARGEIKADVVYGSTFRRARETTQVVAEALGLPIQWDDEFQELRPGEADGWAFERWNEQYGPWRYDQPFTPFSPGGESWAGFLARVGAAFDRVLRQHEGQAIVVVAHGGVIEASFHMLLDLGPHMGARTAFWAEHTGITHWFGRDDEPRWVLRQFNDAAHLRDM